MKKELSIYLDLVRVCAALVVFLGHLSWRSISGGFLWQFQFYGHCAVMVFFVLSGFVIQFSAEQKEKTLLDYSAARFARLYSVVLPALALTLVCDFLGTRHNPGVYHMEWETAPLLRVALGALFLTQSWQKLQLLSNVPFWSLPYEFWYYQIFAGLFFLKGWWRIGVVGIAALMAGPAILMYLPIWLLGAAAWRLSAKTRLPWAGALWALSAAGFAAACLQNDALKMAPSVFLPTPFSPMDYVIALCVALNLLAASQLNFGLAAVGRPIAYAAGMTFALYLLHMPLLHLAAAWLPAQLSAPLRGTLEALFALAMIFALSFVTEGQKKRWRGFFRTLFQRLVSGRSIAGG